MKPVLLIAIFSAFATGLCEEPRPAASQWTFKGASDRGADSFSITAATASQSGNSMNLRSVEIASGAILIRADSADFDPATGQFKPHGKFTIALQKTPGGVPPSLTKELLPRSSR